MFRFKHISNKDFRNNNRDDFANTVCKLLYRKYDGDLDEIYKSGELKQIYNQFDAHIRNIYELIDDHIPMFMYYELKKAEHDKGVSDLSLTEYEYDEYMIITRSACVEYYNNYNN